MLAKKAGAAVNFFNVQWYNQGPTCYTTYTSLFTQSNVDSVCPSFPGTSFSEIVGYGVPASKLVLGKPLQPSDASTGYVSASDLHAFLSNSSSLGVPGVMAWAWDTEAGPVWIDTVYPK
jgi:chitinase